ncbi:protein BPS1, chloroplastic-like [Phragmites australis]|uniref:protein BPS1, chloroplastic-like n=1 Tax=Phragmites australis TaxID=29695 RepID=UPI002D76BA57|nr:protein BPS1, chloroplastic-like [Phragmites australis]
MFLADKYSSLLPSHHYPATASPKANRRQQQQGKAARLDAALAARLRGLLPLPASPLAALARLADLLALTLGEAAPALAGEGDAVAVAAHLDAGVALLDACNAITARLDRLRLRRLLARFALHLLSSSPSSPSSIGRARAALTDRAATSPPPPLPSLPFDQPRGRLSAAARVLVAVNSVSSLAAAAAASVLGGGALAAAFPLVSSDFPWAEAFNTVSIQLSTLATNTSEVDAIDEAVQKLASVLDGEGGIDEAALRAAAQEVEKRTEELTARLDPLSDAVSRVFRAALCLRDAELGSFMVGPTEKTCK